MKWWNKVKSIFWASPPSISSDLMVTYLGYVSSEYTICELADGKWGAMVVLYNKEWDFGFRTFPLELSQPGPEIVFFYLQLLGPLFINTSKIIRVVDSNAVVLNAWSLDKSLTEQGIDLSVEYPNEGDHPPIKQRDLESPIEATNEGPIKLQ